LAEQDGDNQDTGCRSQRKTPDLMRLRTVPTATEERSKISGAVAIILWIVLIAKAPAKLCDCKVWGSNRDALIQIKLARRPKLSVRSPFGRRRAEARHRVGIGSSDASACRRASPA
jgi:hypothetical protein